MERKSIKSVEDFEVYQKAVKVFEDFLEEDLPILEKTVAALSTLYLLPSTFKKGFVT
jgi:hypothetical protein